MLVSSSVRTPTFRPLPPALLQEPQAGAARLQAPARTEPAYRESAHGSVADRARIAQRLMAFGSW
ncbi:hypothetical protein [Aquabacterium sp.]|uniref:hypothetical protein n=1 Tax=Aquabacterium sp. TaxID=1872578 RepID=UPI002CA882F9|nr:hypothetical protein [Aquabacterium sp.]HSW08148.1 hypothetical protein [Aquabacterium sp.]